MQTSGSAGGAPNVTRRARFRAAAAAASQTGPPLSARPPHETAPLAGLNCWHWQDNRQDDLFDLSRIRAQIIISASAHLQASARPAWKAARRPRSGGEPGRSGAGWRPHKGRATRPWSGGGGGSQKGRRPGGRRADVERTGGARCGPAGQIDRPAGARRCAAFVLFRDDERAGRTLSASSSRAPPVKWAVSRPRAPSAAA